VSDKKLLAGLRAAARRDDNDALVAALDEPLGETFEARVAARIIAEQTEAALRRGGVGGDAIAPSSKRTRGPWRRWTPAVATLVVAAAAATLLVRASFFHRPPAGEVARLETEPTRSVEVRFTYPAADTYRPYEVQRGRIGGHDSVPLETLGKLEAEKQYRAIAAGLALSGDARRAAEYLDRAEPSLDVASDRAALAILAGHPDEAVLELDPVLVSEARHPQAWWNQAIALEALHLPLAAADAWEKLAVNGEVGWSTEASRRAAELKSTHDAHRKEWLETVEACNALALRGEIPKPEVVSSHRSNVRSCFYHAMRLAPSVERLRALRPLALALDGGERPGTLARELDRQARAGVAGRLPFLERYATLFATGDLTDGDAGVTRFLEELRTAGQDDLLFGAVDRVRRWRDYVVDLDRIAANRGDPWLRLVAMRAHGKAQEAAGDYSRAERTFAAAVAECDSNHFDSLCARLEYQRVLVLLNAFRLAEAERAGVAAMARAEASSDDVNHMLRVALANIAAARGDYPIARAYGLDAIAREPNFCSGRADAYETSAEGYLLALDPADAKRALELGPRCDVITLTRATELVLLSRMGVKLPETATLRADLDVARRLGTAGKKLYADAIEGNLLLETDPVAGEALLRGTLDRVAEVRANSDAQAAETWSRLSLGWLHSERGEGGAVTELMARGTGLADSRCTLAIGVDHERVFSVLADAEGHTSVVTDAHAAHYPPLRESLAPDAFVTRLRACASVGVIASSPVNGTPRLLPPDLPWGYRVTGPRSAPEPALPPRRLIVSNVEPPPELSLPRLAGWEMAPPKDEAATWLRGSDASVGRVLAELASATEVQFHSHGLVDVGRSDAPLLVLTPDAAGRWGLSARDLTGIHLRGHPVVILAACDTARTAAAPHPQWSLPAAFVEAGARAVVASPEEIPDARAAEFFDSFLERTRAGTPPDAALRDARAAWRGGSWVNDLILFE
jgi:hypothetical protein